MKKIISLVLAVSLLLTMCVTSAFMANAETVVKTTKIDLTQDVANSFATTGNTASTTATVEGGKLKVSISAYERHLTSQSYSSQTWFPNYILKVDNTNFKLTNGNKAIVEVKYKVVSANANADWGAQIGIGNFNGGKGSNIYVRTFKKHTTADAGKEFTLASTFTVDGNYATKIAFAGGGTIEISSIVVHELPAANINDYALVKYVDGTDETTEFVKKNTAPKTPVTGGVKFEGWFASSDFAGEAVTTITDDITLYGMLTFKTTQIDLTQDVANSFATTSNTASTIATVEGGKLKVSISAYERNLTSQTYSAQTWFPNYVLSLGGTDRLSLTKGNKAIVEVKYKVVSANANDTWGAQIGIGNFNGGKGSNIYVRTFKKHTTADAGKEFTLASTFTVDGNYATKIAFAGGGTIEISSIVVYELPAANINDYAVVKYVDGTDEKTEFVKKNTAPKTLTKTGYVFDGWYNASDLSGDAVTTVTADATLYAKWLSTATYDIVRTESTTPDNLVGASSNTSISMSGSKITTSSYNGYNLSANGWSSYRPTFFFLTEKDGVKSTFKTTANAKYIVEMEYVVASNRSDNHSLQVGLFGNIASQGQTENAKWLDTDSQGNKLYKTHPEADNGKTINYTVVFTATSAHNLGLIFYGAGSVTLNKITVKELPADAVEAYALATYVDSGVATTDFVLKNSDVKNPTKSGYEFNGWFDANGVKYTTIKEDVTLTASWFKAGTVDLTQSVKITGEKATMDVTVPTDIETPLNVKIQGFNSILINKTTGEPLTNSWTAGAIVSLKYDAENYVSLNSNSKYIVNVEYDVTNVATSDAVYFPQIAIVYNNNIAVGNVLADNGTIIKTVKKHGEKITNASISCVISGVNSNAVRLAFDGQGTFDIKSVTVTEMINNVDNKLVTFEDSITSTNKIIVAENGAAIADLPRTLLHNFGGWYNGEEKVTTVSGDATLTAKWFDRADVTLNGTVDVIDIVRIKKALADENTDLIYDIDRDNNVLATDATVLRKTLLGVDTLLIAGNDISTYSVNAGAQASFMTARATDSLVETLEGYSKNSTKASSDKKIVVGISNIDDSILKTAALENLTGINGDVYGLNDYKIFLKDDNIYIEAGSDYATAFAVNKFVDFIKKNKIIPAGFVLSGTYNNEKDVLDGYSYVWGDEFNADVLNTGKWWITSENANEAGPLYSKTNSYYLSSRFGGNYGGPWIDPDGNPNMQEGVIERPNVEGEDYYLNDGLLVLNTRKTDKGYTAVRLNGTHQFKYGIMTARVKLATKNGACSTLWARSNDDDKGSSVNEFDFVENFGTESIYPNLHTWNNYSEDTNHKNDIKDCSQTLTPAEGESFSDSFHDIALYWTSEKIVFYFDGVAYLDLDITADPEKWAAFHKTTHMVMGVSAPSGYYAMNYGAKAPGDYLGELINSFSENFSLDYVRVFQK